MTIKTKIASVAVAAAMALSATVANAATYTIPLSPTGGSGSYSMTYSPGSNPAFLDTFKFTLPSIGKLSVLFTSQDTVAKNDNVNFALNGARLTGPGYASTIIPRVLTGVNEVTSAENLLVSAGSYTLTFRGASQAAGQYTAQFTYAIPEPAIWAMMIIGFGAVGASLRTRSRKVALAA